MSRVGIRKTLAKIPDYLRRQRELRKFDRQYGTSTSLVRPLSSAEVVGGDASHSSTHLPTPEPDFRRIMSSPSIPHPELTFIDIGSGMGRVVLMASEYPFRKIIGVEFSRALHAEAQRNLRRFASSRQRCLEIELVCEDATDYALPEAASLLYFHQPFDESLFEKMVAHIDRSLARHPRRLLVVYYEPRHRAVFDRSPLFTLISAEGTVGAADGAWCIYEHAGGATVGDGRGSRR